jgi:acetyltransferase-like isoleucine patch superfamily enzyme
MRPVWLALYYGCFRAMPSTSMPFGRLGNRLRTAAARGLFSACGVDVVVKRNAYFGTGEGIVIGDRSQLGEGARVANNTRIGADVMMGLEVLILSVRHAYERTDVPMIAQGYHENAPVVVGDDVWIGARAIILPGCRIGNHAVVAAGAVVTRSVPEWAVVGGVPAEVISWRNAQD